MNKLREDYVQLLRTMIVYFVLNILSFACLVWAFKEGAFNLHEKSFIEWALSFAGLQIFVYIASRLIGMFLRPTLPMDPIDSDEEFWKGTDLERYRQLHKQ